MARLVIDMPNELGAGPVSAPQDSRQATGEQATEAGSTREPTSADVDRFVAWFDCWSDRPFSR